MLAWPKTIAALTVGSVLLTAGCASNQKTSTANSVAVDKATQQAMTPDQAQARLVAGNKRFVEEKGLQRDYFEDRRATSMGQYPFAVVLACVDSRSAPEIVFDQGLGDLFVPRLAGNYAQADVLGAMEFATKVSGAKLVVVVGHTECGAVKGACDNVELGNLTAVIKAIRPAVDNVKDITTDRTSKNAKFVQAVAEMNVRLTIQKIRSDSPILREMEDAHQIKIVGAMYDITDGHVTFLN